MSQKLSESQVFGHEATSQQPHLDSLISWICCSAVLFPLQVLFAIYQVSFVTTHEVCVIVAFDARAIETEARRASC
jgi:hypothetical protein